MGRFKYPRELRKVKEGEEYVFLRDMHTGSLIYKSGDRVDITKLSRLRLRQLVEWRRIVPRWYYEERIIDKDTKPKVSTRGKQSKKRAGKKVVADGTHS